MKNLKNCIPDFDVVYYNNAYSTEFLAIHKILSSGTNPVLHSKVSVKKMLRAKDYYLLGKVRYDYTFLAWSQILQEPSI